MKKCSMWIVLSLSLLVAFTPAFAAAGSLDSTFGNNGIVETNFGPDSNFTYSDAAFTSNGDIVVAGTVTNFNGQATACVVVRYLPNGLLDPSFGSGGIVTLPASSFASLFGMLAVQANGQILVVIEPQINGALVTALMRLNTNGKLDPTFGSGGLVTVNLPTPATFTAAPSLLLAQPDGKILLAGASTPPRRSTLSPQTILIRYLSSGALDTTFGSGGVTSVVAISAPTTLGLLSGDGILALNGSGQLAQFTSAGAPLKTPVGGTVIAAKQNATTAAAFLPNGEFLLGGSVFGPDGRSNLDAVVHRFLVTGAADPAFLSPPISFVPNGANVGSGAGQFVTDSLGRIVAGGGVETLSSSLWGVARLAANGSLDASFGNGGVVATQVGVTGFLSAVFVQPNNEIIAVGEVRDNNSLIDLAIARYRAQ